MRTIKVPFPKAVWELSIEGPMMPVARNVAAARERLRTALSGLPRLDVSLGQGAWTVVWRSAILESGPFLKAWLWCARPDLAAELVAAVGTELAAFRVRGSPRPVTAAAGLEPTVVYVRSGSFRVGLEPRTEPMMKEIGVVEEDRVDVDLCRRFRFRVQRCPACGVGDNPAALVAGFPSIGLLLASELGEVAFADGGLVDPHARENARCRHCGVDFIAR